MKLFIDSADVAQIRDISARSRIDGVTTNPTLISKTGRSMAQVIAEICEVVPDCVSAEVAAEDTEGMLREAKILAAISPKVVIKIPMTWPGLTATERLTEMGLRTNVTLCFTVSQAVMAARSGATFVSPFVGRLDDQSANGLQLLHDIRTAYDNYGFKTFILAASLRNRLHVDGAALAGSDYATLPPAVFGELLNHPLTNAGLAQFAKDWAASGQTIG
jgi:transaldolase